MKLTFLGSGSHGTLTNYQSNMLLNNSGKNLLIDCGTDIRRSLHANGYRARDIDAVFISHLHSDHAGGMEWLAYNTYFDPSRYEADEYVHKPTLYVEDSMLDVLWTNTLMGSLRTVRGKATMRLSDYFEICTFRPFDNIRWNDMLIATVAALHVDGLSQTEYSHGLNFIGSQMQSVFITTDTQFDPSYFKKWYENNSLIFHEAETTSYKSGVHAHYTDLQTLPDEVRAKMWLYHHSDDNPFHESCQQSGFKGFVTQGQTFIL